ncbi:hypothetical protein Dsin_020047 [Dipteronia sinensis]|uniref:non-specific serine/threonine protein kinase n=1 Tax=Dipteronia sinensis TaxID=43782 RepID=A0AAE0A8K1_9ROSI|nr:hypothetical protein Dsin_020047 [Dipteronia sinensis]
MFDCWGIQWNDACLTMRLFWWQQLPLLILIQLLESSSTSHKIYAEALLACKSTLVNPRQSGNWIGRLPCIRQPPCLSFYEPTDPGVVSLRIAASVDGDSSVPTLTPAQGTDNQKPRKQRVAAIVGGIGAALLVIVILVLVYICLMRFKRFTRRTSDGESSVPSPSIELGRGGTSPYAGDVSPNGALRQLTILELKHATCDFSQSNIIGEGEFGLVYKGLLQDGSMVAIKRHLHTPIRNFLHEVRNNARIHHRHLVKLVGYYEDNHQQLLVLDYIPNGNVGNHLYGNLFLLTLAPLLLLSLAQCRLSHFVPDSEGLPIGRLNMRQRLLIALGAARGLEHLHSLVPPLFHMHFRTSNVLLDETFTAKVSDYGLHKLLIEDHHAGSSSAIDCFIDPELSSSKNFSASSDVYSFGVFLLELISGQDSHGRNQLNSDQNLVLQAKRGSSLDDYIDKTLGDQTGDAAREMMELALQCIDISRRRPSTRHIVEVFERIQDGEIGRLDSEFGEDIGAVTLGSELFR